MVLNDLTVSNGYLGSGGGIFNYGTLTVSNCTLTNNLAHTYGGGIFNGGTLAISNSTLASNSAVVQGGGIFNNTGCTLTVSNSTFLNNAATHNGAGGGIVNLGTMTVSDSTFAGNTANGGGAIGNAGMLTVNDRTLANNSGSSGGGGILSSASGTLNLANTIIANSLVGVDLYNAGSVATAQNNLIGSQSGTSIQNGVNGNIVGANPLLASLGNNGGPTQTFALLPGSPAIDAGNNALAVDAQGQHTDHRPAHGAGYPRIVNGTVDIGASEYTPPATVTGTTPSLTGGTLPAATTSLQINFNESVLNANQASNYQLQSVGADGLLGTADDVIVPVSASYTGTTATLTFQRSPFERLPPYGQGRHHERGRRQTRRQWRRHSGRELCARFRGHGHADHAADLAERVHVRSRDGRLRGGATGARDKQRV